MTTDGPTAEFTAQSTAESTAESTAAATAAAVPPVTATRVAASTATYVITGTAEQALTATRWAVARTGGLVTGLAARGVAEQERARRRAAAAGWNLLDGLAVNPVVNRVVDAQIERIVRPLVSIVLDEVLAALDDQPERVRALIRGQRESIADDLIGRVRSGALAADSTIDRMTARLLRRTAQQRVAVQEPATQPQPLPRPLPAPS
jgi:hypothetical protein